MTVGWWALRHRAAIAVALAAAVVGGVLAARSLPSGIYPEVDFPRIIVVARGGDAPPDVFQTTVTRPLEQQLVTVLGVRRVRSRTIRGTTEVSLQFVPGTDMWRALQLVESRLNVARASIPPDIEIETERLTTTAFPVVTFNLAGPLDPRDLHDLAEYVVRPALARVPGVGLVKILGGDVREVEVVLDPDRAASMRVLPPDVARRVADETPIAAVGRFDQDRHRVTVLVSGEARTLDDLASVPVAQSTDGTPLPLRSIATVGDGHVDRTVGVGGPRGETVVISVSRLLGASTPEVVHAVQSAAASLVHSLPRGVTIETVYDQAALVDESIASVRDSILLGIALCVVVLGLSLRDARAGLVAATTVPTTLAVTFIVMKALNQTLNVMSLGGMAVAIGLVIDDAIVVIEAIARRLEHGESPEKAAAEGTHDLAAAVVGTTITTVIVFVPLAFVQGLVGDFFSALAGTLSVAVIVSLGVALLAVPPAAASFLRARVHSVGASRMERAYGAMANWGAHRKWVGVVLLAVAIAMGAWAAHGVGSGFLPSMDEGAFVVDYFMPAGTSLAETVATAQKIERILKDIPEVQTYSRRTGAELGPATATEMNRGDIMVRLVDPAHRHGKSTEDIIAAVRARAAREVPEARVEFVQVLQDVLNDLSGNARPIEVKVFGEDPAVLARIAHDITTRIEHTDGLVDYYGGVEAAAPVLVFRARRDVAARLGRTPADLVAEIGAMLAGAPAGHVRRFDRFIGIRVRYPDAVRYDPAAVMRLPLVAGNDGVVPVSAVTDPVREMIPSQWMHEGLQPVVIIQAGTEGRDLGSVFRDVHQRLATLRLPQGYRMEIGGQIESQAETYRNLGAVTGIGLLLTLVVLTAQFRRVRPAIAVLLTVPFAIAGALLTLRVTGVPLNASSLMGCVLLVGLEVKTGILLLEVAEEAAGRGVPYPEALALAAKRRIRPIMLTTTATMFGVAPLAMGIGAGAEIQRPLAVAVLGGIVFSKFMNLAALPSLAVLLATPKPMALTETPPAE